MPIGEQQYRVGARLFASGGSVVVREFGKVGRAGDEQFGRAQRRAEALSRAVGGFVRQLRFIVPALGAGALALSHFGRQAIDASAKMAISLQSTTAGVQALQHAADLAGLRFRELRTGTLFLTRNLSQAAAGFGPVVQYLDVLRLSAGQLLDLPIDERIIAVQEAISRYVPAAQRAAVASAFFGETAGLMFARLDPRTLRQARADLEAFGATTDEIGAVQVQVANDALTRFGLLADGIARQVAVATAPGIKRLADEMSSLAIEMRIVERIGRLAAATANAIADVASLLANNLERLAFWAGTLAVALTIQLIPAIYALATSLAALQAAAAFLLRLARALLFIGAVIAVAELARAIWDLRRALGSWGELWTLITEIVVETWQRMVRVVIGLWYRLQARFFLGVAAIVGSLRNGIEVMTDAWAGMIRFTVRAWYELRAALFTVFSAIVRNFAVVVVRGLASAWESLTTWMGEILGVELGDGAKYLREFESTLEDTERRTRERATAIRMEGILAAQAIGQNVDDRFDANRWLGELNESADSYIARAEEIEALNEGGHESINRLLSALRSVRAETERPIDTSGLDLPGTEGLREVAQIAPDEETITGWRRAQELVRDYVDTAQDWGTQVGNAIVGALSRVEDAFVKFATEGKLSFRDLADSIIADLARIAYRQAIIAPIGDFIGSVIGGFGAGGNATASVAHGGGVVGRDRLDERVVPASAFVGARRFHQGGFPGLRPDEVPIIAQRGERILSRDEQTGGSSVTVNIDARGAQQGIAEQIDARLRQALPEIQRAAVGAVAVQRRRGVEV